MITVTINNLKEVYNRYERTVSFDVYISQFIEQLKAERIDDVVFQINNAVGEYVWRAAWDTFSREEFSKRIHNLKEYYEITLDRHGNEVGYAEHLESDYYSTEKKISQIT